MRQICRKIAPQKHKLWFAYRLGAYILVEVCSVHEQGSVDQCLQTKQDEIPDSLVALTGVGASHAKLPKNKGFWNELRTLLPYFKIINK